jgi:Holliday junction resolvase
MGGLMSRRKGARGELSLCLYLNLLGYDARRVIRTRAVKGYENDVVPDVIATKDGVEYTFESKYRKDAYKSIYTLYNKLQTGGVYRFQVPQTPSPLYVAIGEDFEEVKRSHDVHFYSLSLNGSDNTPVHMRITRLQALLKGAQYLCIKDNNKKPLFIRFWS